MLDLRECDTRCDMVWFDINTNGLEDQLSLITSRTETTQERENYSSGCSG